MVSLLLALHSCSFQTQADQLRATQTQMVTFKFQALAAMTASELEAIE
jgi:hypothetical protein